MSFFDAIPHLPSVHQSCDVPDSITGCEEARAHALPDISICCAPRRFAIYSLLQLCPEVQSYSCYFGWYKQ